MPRCHLSSTPVEIGSSIFSCSEFPRGSYAYTSPFKEEAWRHGPEDSLPVPTWLLAVTDTAGTAQALQAPVLLGVLTDMLGEGMGQSPAPTQTYLVPAVPTCPKAACSGSQRQEACFCPSRWAARPWPWLWAGPTPESHSCVFWES